MTNPQLGSVYIILENDWQEKNQLMEQAFGMTEEIFRMRKGLYSFLRERELCFMRMMTKAMAKNKKPLITEAKEGFMPRYGPMFSPANAPIIIRITGNT